LIDKRKFEDACAFQYTPEKISGLFNCGIEELDEFCEKEYKCGFEATWKMLSGDGRLEFLRAQFLLAEKSASMAMYLDKTRFGGNEEKFTVDEADLVKIRAELRRSLSDKQYKFYVADDSRINVLVGSVRSGKTWISLLKFAYMIFTSPEDYEFLMAGKTITTLKRNCFSILDRLAGEKFVYNSSCKEGRLYGRKIYFEGAADRRAESKIRGMTLGGAYVDELTQVPKDFYNMLLSRLSLPQARFFATTNPDSPAHYVKRDIVDNRSIDLTVWNFSLDDNVFLDKEYVAQVKREYSGVFYARYVLGEWKNAEGLIYDMFDADKHVCPTVERNYEKYYAACDYGTQNPTVFGLWGLYGEIWYKVKEYHYSGRESGVQKTDGQFADDLTEFLGRKPITAVIIDPSAASFIAEVKSRGINAIKANNDVLDGVRLTAKLLERREILFNDCCVKTIEEFGTYCWQDGADGDRPVKENDHHMDETRYFCVKVLGGKGKMRFL
jgi:PBSX family phage terminase large subunit